MADSQQVGTISEAGLRPVLLQVLQSGLPVGILQVAGSTHSGAMLIRNGSIKAAISPAAKLHGMPALMQILASTEGKYRYSGNLPREPIKEIIDVDLGALLSWRNPAAAGDQPFLVEALAAVCATTELQEALRAYEEKRQTEAKKLNVVPGAWLDTKYDPDAPTRINMEAIKEIPTPSVEAPDREHTFPGDADWTASYPEVTLPKKRTWKQRLSVSVGIGLAVMMTVLVLTGLMLRQDSANQEYIRGTKNLQGSYYDLARKSFDKVLKLDPDNVDARLQRAKANVGLLDYPAALFDYDAVIKLHPDNISALNGRADTFYKQGNFKQALVAAQQALAVNPQHADSLLLSARAQIGLGEHLQAIEAASRLIEAKDKSGDLAAAYAVRGDALFQTKKFAEARNDYSSALEINGNDRSIFGKRARVEFELHNHNAAIADATQAIFADSTNPELHMLRGSSHEKLGQLDKALADYDKAVGLKPDLETYGARARMHVALKKFNRAVADLEQILKNPNAPAQYKDQLSSLQEKIKSLPVAQIDMEELVGKEEPTRVLTYEQMVQHGMQLLNANQSVQAVKVLLIAVKANPKDLQARRYLARAYARAGNSAQAIQEFKLQPSLENEDKFAYGTALYDLKQYRPATQFLNAVVSQSPDNHEARMLLIHSLLCLNEKPDALELCRVGLSRAQKAEDQEKFQKLYKAAQEWQPQ